MILEEGMNIDSCKDLDLLLENNGYEIIYNNHWSDYEESGFIYILEKENKFYEYSYQYSVMAEDNTMYWEPIEVTLEQILEEIINWEKEEEFVFVSISKDAWDAANYNNYLKHFIYSNNEFPLEFINSSSPNKFTLYTNPLLCISDIDGNIDDNIIVSINADFMNQHFNETNYPLKRKNLRSVNNILDDNLIDSFLTNNKIDYLFEDESFIPSKLVFSNLTDIDKLPYRKLLNENFREVIYKLHEQDNKKNSFFY